MKNIIVLMVTSFPLIRLLAGPVDFDPASLLGFEPEEEVRISMPGSSGQAVHSFSHLPLHFERNEGQAGAETKFLVRGRGYLLSLEQTETLMVLTPPPRHQEPKAEVSLGDLRAFVVPEPSPRFLRMTLVGANPFASISGEEPLPGKFNYFIGNDPSLWRTNISTFAKVRYREVYPGIDLVYNGNEGQLEYDFVVAPGANPRRIELAIEGADKVEVDNGDLRLEIEGRELRWRKPRIFQEIHGSRIEVAGEYALRPPSPDDPSRLTHHVSFNVAAYDTALPLVIDPVLAYSTYLGGGGGEWVESIAVDSEGNAYLAGDTGSSTLFSSRFPTTTNSVQRQFSASLGGPAVFVTKLSPAGDRMIYSTVLSGKTDGYAYAYAIVVDSAGGAVIAGGTSWTDFPTHNALQPAHGGGANDLFVAKLSADGSALNFSTYLGGSDSEFLRSLASDAQANLYIVGITRSADFPMVHALQPTAESSINPFVARIASDGSGLDYSTYLSPLGASDGYMLALAVDPAGHAIVAGNTITSQGIDLPLIESDAFIQRLSLDGQALEYSTTHVTGGQLSVKAIALGADGSVFLGGSTYSKALPSTPGAFQTNPGGAPAGFTQENIDGFIARFNLTTSTLEYLTYLGGSDRDQVTCLAVDAAGNAYAGGSTDSPDFPVQDAIQSLINQGLPPVGYWDNDAFVLKLSPDGRSLHWSTFLGGGKGANAGAPGPDRALALALGPEGAVYFGGSTESSDFPVMNPLQRTLKQQSPAAAQDGFIAKIIDVPPAPAAVQITRSGNTIALSWPFSATGFGLEVSDSLVPVPKWATESTAPETVGDQNVVTLEIGSGTKFFRLRKP